MTTISHTELADIAQNTLSDAGAATWSQDIVEEWVLQALRDYGTHFSLIRTTTITCAANDRDHALGSTVNDIVNVLYPYDSTDPNKTGTQLHRRDRRDPGFWDHPGYYDVLPTRSADSDNHPSILYISEKPTAGDVIYIEYTASSWDISAIPETDIVYIPHYHVTILVQFIVFLATQERLAKELQDPDRTLHLVDDLTKAVATAKKIYNDMIKAAKASRSEGLITPPWEMDAFDQIY